LESLIIVLLFLFSNSDQIGNDDEREDAPLVRGNGGLDSIFAAMEKVRDLSDTCLATCDDILRCHYNTLGTSTSVEMKQMLVVRRTLGIPLALFDEWEMWM
jgi:hypothetical protein